MAAAMVPRLRPFKIARLREPAVWNSAARLHHTAAHLEHLRAADNVAESYRIGARHPDLRAEICQRVIERGAARRVEMGDDLVEQQQRRKAGHLLDQPGMREH